MLGAAISFLTAGWLAVFALGSLDNEGGGVGMVIWLALALPCIALGFWFLRQPP